MFLRLLIAIIAGAPFMACDLQICPDDGYEFTYDEDLASSYCAVDVACRQDALEDALEDAAECERRAEEELSLAAYHSPNCGEATRDFYRCVASIVSCDELEAPAQIVSDDLARDGLDEADEEMGPMANEGANEESSLCFDAERRMALACSDRGLEEDELHELASVLCALDTHCEAARELDAELCSAEAREAIESLPRDDLPRCRTAMEELLSCLSEPSACEEPVDHQTRSQRAVSVPCESLRTRVAESCEIAF